MSHSATNETDVRLAPAFFERLFEHAGLAIFACDPQGRALRWNAPADAVLRTRGMARPGVAMREVLPESDRSSYDDALERVRQSLDACEFRSSTTRADGSQADYAVWLTPLLADDGALEGVAIWFHDVTVQAARRRATRKDERLGTLGAMSGAVADHYNNLLCSIGTSLDIALSANSLNGAKRALTRAVDATTRASQLTRQLLAFAQGDWRSCDLADLTEIVLYFIDENETAWSHRGVRAQLDWDVIPCVEVPREHMMLILSSLANNAIEAMPDGGTLTIALRPHDAAHVTLALSDSGPGIRDEDMERLFEPFFTTKGGSATAAGRHAGMGLAVVHGLVRELGGRIAASNARGGGARFEIILPIENPLSKP